jgi:DUF4097 and DUF4098 domain-containing protein YvlB
MKKLTAVILILLSLFCLCSCKAGDINLGIYAPYWNFWNYSAASSFTYSASEITEVNVIWVGGTIDVVSSKKSELSVTENSEDLADDAKMHYIVKDGKLTIHYTKALYREDVDASKKHLRIEIPEGIELDIDSVNAFVKIDEMALGEIKITNVSGHIEFGNLAASKVKIENVDGSVVADEIVADEFSSDSVSGALSISKISANKVKVQTVSGKTTLGLAKKSKVDISGVSGEVELYVDEKLGAMVKFSTMSGKFSSDKPHTTGEIYTFGLGEIEIDVETVSGNLKIY